jgi:hypothetical protein
MRGVLATVDGAARKGEMVPPCGPASHPTGIVGLVSTRALLFLAALTGLAILVAFAVQVMVAS